MLQSCLKQVAKIMGMKKSKLTSHSLRRGAVLWAQKNGVDESMIKVYGDWSSDAYKKYLQFPLKTRLEVGQKIIHKLEDLRNLV